MDNKNISRSTNQKGAEHTLLMEHIKQVKDGSVSIIKQDGKIIQINLCQTIGPDAGETV
jgi:hypothetical protein